MEITFLARAIETWKEAVSFLSGNLGVKPQLKPGWCRLHFWFVPELTCAEMAGDGEGF